MPLSIKFLTVALRLNIVKILEQIIYLGFIFQYNTKFKKAEKQLSDQGRKAMIGLSVNIRCMLLSHIGNNIERATSCFLLASVKRFKFNAAVFAE